MATKKTNKNSVTNLTRELRQREAELAIINSVQAALAAQLDIHGIYEAVGEKLREIFNYQDVTIYSADLRSRIVTVEYSYELGQKSERRSVPMNSLYEYFLTSNRTFVFNGDLPSLAAKFSDYQNLEPPKSLLAVPVRRNKDTEPVVYLTIQDWSGKKFFSDSDVRLMETLANSMSVALENARLFDETQRLLKETEQRNAELAVINSIQAGLASKLEMQAIYNLIGEKIRDIFKAETVAINHYDQEHDLISTPYLWSQGKRLSNEEPAPLSDSPLRKSMIDSRKSWIINRDSENIPKSLSANPDEQLGRWPKSGIGTAIVALDKVIGLIQILNMEQENTYTDADLHLLETISNSMSVALENARLFDETQQRNAELSIINSVQEGLASKLEMQGIYDLVGEKVREIFDANTVTLVTFDLDKKTIHPRYAFEKGQRLFIEPMPIPEIYKNFIRRGQPLLVNNRLVEYFKGIDPGFKPLAGETPMSALAVPLTMNGEMRGLVSLQNIDRENAFSESDVRLLQTLTNSMSVALENARLWEQEKMFRKALQRELEIGREIQAGFLPETLPRAAGWEIAASLMSAREVAGDFYDAFELPDGTIGLVIADVCDKGVGAALFMTLFRSLIRAAANLDYFEHTEKSETPHTSVERLRRAISLTNNYIAETHGESGMFATLFFGILDPSDGRLVYVNGGHESPLMVQSGTLRETLRRTGPAVGVLANARFDILETQMQPGEAFFAFTDGVPDCQNPRGEFFGRERLLDSLQRMSGSAPELVAAIESELRQYIASASQFDDITLLAVKRA